MHGTVPLGNLTKVKKKVSEVTREARAGREGGENEVEETRGREAADRPANRRLKIIVSVLFKNSRFEASRSLKIVENALSISGLYRAKSVGALSHTLGGARKRIAVHQNSTNSSYILRTPAFWDCTKTLRPPKDGQKEGGRGRGTRQ